ncbi:MAG: nuclear transport factor 2 family protein [Pseudomonadota bacterium]|nr:nuclear transport factor 2 family protein [Pseudomonadota bacterium]
MTTATTLQPTSRDEGAILALLTRVRQAHHDKDARAIAECYAASAVICDLSPPLAHHGIDMAEKQAWLDSWDGPIELEPRDGKLTIDGDTAVMQGYTRMSGRPKAAGEPISFWLRDTICLKRGGDGWRIVHLHSSVPFYMDGSLRPAFDLQP